MDGWVGIRGENDEERLMLGVWGEVKFKVWGSLGGCVVWVLLSVLLSRFKASSIIHPGGGLT